MTYTKEDLNSSIPRIARKAKDYFDSINVKEVSFSSFTVAELKADLEARGLSTSGRKSTLIKRLEGAE